MARKNLHTGLVKIIKLTYGSANPKTILYFKTYRILPLAEANRLPIDQCVEVVERGGIIIRRPAIGVDLDVAMEIQQGNQPLALTATLWAAHKFVLGLF